MKNFNLSLNIAESLSRAGGVLDQFITPKVYEATGKLWIPYFIGFCLSVLSFFFSLFVVYLSNKADKKDGIVK